MRLFLERPGDPGEFFGGINLVMWTCSLILGSSILFYGTSHYSYREEVWSLISMFRPRPAPPYWFTGDTAIICFGAVLSLIGFAGIIWIIAGLVKKKQKI